MGNKALLSLFGVTYDLVKRFVTTHYARAQLRMRKFNVIGVANSHCRPIMIKYSRDDISSPRDAGRVII